MTIRFSDNLRDDVHGSLNEVMLTLPTFMETQKELVGAIKHREARILAMASYTTRLEEVVLLACKAWERLNEC